MRWLGLPRCECELYADKDGGYLPAVWIADTLAELVRTALRTGEITFVEGPEAAMEELELRDSGILRALRVVFRADPTLPVTMDFPGDLTVPPLTAEETSGSDPAPARSARRAADPRPALISGAFDRDEIPPKVHWGPFLKKLIEDRGAAEKGYGFSVKQIRRLVDRERGRRVKST